MLIVNADDFGIEETVNRSIVKLIREGICSSTTIMPNMPAFEDACNLAVEHGFSQHIGMHLVLTQGMPLTTDIRKESRFCSKDGEFCLLRDSPVLFLSIREKIALAAEIRAQIKKCRDYGIAISHIDSHHHVHTEWAIANVLIPIVSEARIPFVRLSRNMGNPYTILKSIYKHIYNIKLKINRMNGTDYFGSTESCLMFKSKNKDEEVVIEIGIHPYYKGEELYVDGSMNYNEYLRVMGGHLKKEKIVSFHDLIMNSASSPIVL